MSIIVKADLAAQNITIGVQRICSGFSVDIKKEFVHVQYTETKYTGTIGAEDYVQISSTEEHYVSDFAAWLVSDAGQAIKAAIEASLSQSDPNT